MCSTADVLRILFLFFGPYSLSSGWRIGMLMLCWPSTWWSCGLFCDYLMSRTVLGFADFLWFGGSFVT